MSKPLVISIPHKLDKEQAVGRLKNGLTRASSTLPVITVEDETWTGDRMTFRVRALGQLAYGLVDVGDSDVHIEVTLPWMLEKFGHALKAALETRGRLLLGNK